MTVVVSEYTNTTLRAPGGCAGWHVISRLYYIEPHSCRRQLCEIEACHILQGVTTWSGELCTIEPRFRGEALSEPDLARWKLDHELMKWEPLSILQCSMVTIISQILQEWYRANYQESKDSTLKALEFSWLNKIYPQLLWDLLTSAPPCLP